VATPWKHAARFDLVVPGGAIDLEFSPNGRWLGVAAGSIALTTWDRKTVPEYLRDDGENYGVVRFETTGQQVLTVSARSELLVLTAELSLFGPRQNAAAFYTDLASNTRALPGVAAAGVINDLPALSGSSGASRAIFHATDSDFQNLVMKRPVAMIRGVTAGYFAASGTALQAGRFFAAQEPAPVALASASLVRSLWPNEPPAAVIGRIIRQGNVTGPLIAIAGVLEDVRPGDAMGELPPFLYRPYSQWASGSATLVVRTAQDPATLAPAIRAAIHPNHA
jgi:hypothetical protein